MPKRAHAITPQTADFLFAKTLRGVPTPWFATGQTIDGNPMQIKLRLWIRRRGRTLYVETHKDSPAYPGRRVPVSLQRQGLYQVYTAGVTLVSMAKLDPTSVPAYPRYVWNKSHAQYLDRIEIATTVCKGLHRLLNPKRGRPRNEVIGDIVRPGRPMGMRVARRKEILMFTDKVLAATNPMLDRVHDAVRMRGYEKAEREEIMGMVGAIHRQARLLRTLVFDDKILNGDRTLDANTVLGLVPQNGQYDNDIKYGYSPDTPWPPMPPTPDTVVGFELPSNL